MQFATLLAVAAAVLGVEAKIGFTHVPGSSVTAGQTFSIEWDGASAGSPVTITLKRGDPSNLRTVALLTGDGSNGKFSWTPSTSLPDADDYALEISQGTGYDSTNYSGEFAIVGGSSAAATSGAAASSTGSAAASSGAGGAVVTITSGGSTYVTTEATGMMTGTASGAGNMTRTANSTALSTSPTPTTGGIVVASAASSTVASSHKPTSTGNSAAVLAPVSGVAALLMGIAAFL